MPSNAAEVTCQLRRSGKSSRLRRFRKAESLPFLTSEEDRPRLMGRQNPNRSR